MNLAQIMSNSGNVDHMAKHEQFLVRQMALVTLWLKSSTSHFPGDRRETFEVCFKRGRK